MQKVCNIRTAYNTMVANSGMTKAALAAKLGKAPNYVSNIISRYGNGKSPKVATYITIADACGYDIIARHRSTHDEIIIEPPGGSSGLIG